MTWSLDTNVVSQFAPGESDATTAASALRAWTRLHTHAPYLSAVTITEITAGTGKLRTAGATSCADRLQLWLDEIVARYADRVLPIDIMVAKAAGFPSERARSVGHAPGLADLLIAATADHHGHGLLTDNVRHFEPLNLSVPTLNPLRDALPR